MALSRVSSFISKRRSDSPRIELPSVLMDRQLGKTIVECRLARIARTASSNFDGRKTRRPPAVVVSMLFGHRPESCAAIAERANDLGTLTPLISLTHRNRPKKERL